jgi:methyl-accepting chemotaxis protein
MSQDEKTLEMFPPDRILQAINELRSEFNGRLDALEDKIDAFKKETEENSKSDNTQFEAIRTGIVANSAAFDRLTAKVLNMNANLTEIQEELRQQNKEAENVSRGYVREA